MMRNLHVNSVLDRCVMIPILTRQRKKGLTAIFMETLYSFRITRAYETVVDVILGSIMVKTLATHAGGQRFDTHRCLLSLFVFTFYLFVLFSFNFLIIFNFTCIK